MNAERIEHLRPSPKQQQIPHHFLTIPNSAHTKRQHPRPAAHVVKRQPSLPQLHPVPGTVAGVHDAIALLIGSSIAIVITMPNSAPAQPTGKAIATVPIQVSGKEQPAGMQGSTTTAAAFRRPRRYSAAPASTPPHRAPSADDDRLPSPQAIRRSIQPAKQQRKTQAAEEKSSFRPPRSKFAAILTPAFSFARQ